MNPKALALNATADPMRPVEGEHMSGIGDTDFGGLFMLPVTIVVVLLLIWVEIHYFTILFYFCSF